MTYLKEPEEWSLLGGDRRTIELNPDIVLQYTGRTEKWIGRLTGERCKGVESWEIDDDTGAIKYLGSSITP